MKSGVLCVHTAPFACLPGFDLARRSRTRARAEPQPTPRIRKRAPPQPPANNACCRSPVAAPGGEAREGVAGSGRERSSEQSTSRFCIEVNFHYIARLSAGCLAKQRADCLRARARDSPAGSAALGTLKAGVPGALQARQAAQLRAGARSHPASPGAEQARGGPRDGAAEELHRLVPQGSCSASGRRLSMPLRQLPQQATAACTALTPPRRRAAGPAAARQPGAAGGVQGRGPRLPHLHPGPLLPAERPVQVSG